MCASLSGGSSHSFVLSKRDPNVDTFTRMHRKVAAGKWQGGKFEYKHGKPSGESGRKTELRSGRVVLPQLVRSESGMTETIIMC